MQSSNAFEPVDPRLVPFSILPSLRPGRSPKRPLREQDFLIEADVVARKRYKIRCDP